ncbi:hypothetical protein BS47DRAFT_1355297 [Hydnum rufescens UP504]|uniref:Uncharacterized protein n=1 Tax=Hydnum rufescens UP504 TaxID=1448309 RepID=A0A9P6AG65_9AGAM|nr:hypothetical protein BS47DRAFT_1355297 [Hydnum rufescens UP504]
MAFLPMSSAKTFKGLISLHTPLGFCRLCHSECLPESKLNTYTRADPKHGVRAHLLLCAISLQLWTHLHALGVELVSQPSPQVFPYHSHQAQRR